MDAAQQRDILAELFDANRVNLWCAKHNYYGPIRKSSVNPMQVSKPALGCADCWKIFYISELATTPPAERRQKLEEIEEVLHNVVQLVEEGKWDFNPYAHPEVEIGTE